MTDTIKRLVSLVLVFVLVIGMFPTAYASETADDTETLTTSVDIPEASAPETTFPEETGEAAVTEATETTPAVQPEESTASTVPTGTEEGTEPTFSSEEAAVSDSTDATLPSESSGAPEPSTEATEPSTAATEVSTPSEPSQPADEPAPPESTHATEETGPSDSTQPPEETESSEETAPSEETELSEEMIPSEETDPSDPPETDPSIAGTAPEPTAEPTEPASATDETPPTVPVSDPTADVESPAVWESTFANITLTGDPAADLLAIAASQLGYTESTRNFLIEGEGEDAAMYGYTRYGAWYGLPYGDWCAMFVSFCLNYAGLTDIPSGAGCQSWLEALSEKGLYYTSAWYAPASGDVAFYDLDGDGKSDHVGIITELSEDGYLTIEGNYSDTVTYVRRTTAEVLGFLRIAGEPILGGEPAYAQRVSIGNAGTAVSPLSEFTEAVTDVAATHRPTAIWLNSSHQITWPNGTTTDAFWIHTMQMTDGTKLSYCIEPGIYATPGAGYSGGSGGWYSLDEEVRKALGITLLYGAPNCYTSGMSLADQLAYQAATQVIVHEIVCGYRSADNLTGGGSGTPIYDALTASGVRDISCDAGIYYSLGGTALDKELFVSAYNEIANKIENHKIVPSFAITQDDADNGVPIPVWKLKYEPSTGLYEISVPDDYKVFSRSEFVVVSGNGLTYTKTENTLKITAPASMAGQTVSCAWDGTAGVYKDVPDPSSQTYLLWSGSSNSGLQQQVMHYAYRDDPVGMLFNVEIPDNTSISSSMRVQKTAVRGNDVEGYDLKFWNSTTGDVFYLKTDSSGVGCEATVNSDGSYTITGGSTIEGFTAGTYDILEILANKGKDIVYPSKITIDIQDSSGKSIGNGWPKYFYSPGGELSDPVKATQNSGTAGTITIDSSTGNARLNDVTFSESDLGAGKTVVITINNDKYHGDVTLKKTSTNGSVSGACFKIYRWTSSDIWYVKTSTSGVGYKASYDETTGSYTGTSTKGFKGATDGTYDLVEDLVAMGQAGKMFPTSWTITVYNSAGTVVNTKTYTEAAGQITKDDNGNARLSKISISGIEKGGYVSMTINNEPTTRTVTVKKTSNDGKVSGINFTVKNNTTGTGSTYSTGKDGTFTFSATVGHSLTFTETVPTGYTASPKSKTITVDADESKNVVSFANTVNAQTLNIYKTSDTGVVTGVTFTIVGTDVLGTKINKSVTITKKDSQGRGIVSTTLYPGTYTITETVPTGYTCASTNPQTVTIAYGSDNNVYFKNTVNEQTLTLYKTSDDGVVTGMSFTITGTNVKGEAVNKTVTITQKDSQGRGVIATKLYPGTYSVTENVPEGYLCDSPNPQTVVLAVGSPNSVTFQNHLIRGNFHLTKKEIGTETVLEGAVYEIKYPNGTLVGTYTTDVTGVIEIKELPYGKGYTYQETQAPDGFELDDTVYTFDITEDKKTYYYTRENEPTVGSIEIIKASDDGSVIEGVTLRLDYSIYDKATNSWSEWAPVTHRANDSLVTAGGCTSTGLVNGELATDETGRVKFEGLRTNSQVLRIRYRVTEVSTVSGVSLLTDAAFIGELPYDFGDGSAPSVDVQCKIVNSSVFMFPPTGEYDLMLTTIGPVLMALAIAMSLVFFAPSVFHGTSAANKKSYLGKEMHK